MKTKEQIIEAKFNDHGVLISCNEGKYFVNNIKIFIAAMLDAMEEYKNQDTTEYRTDSEDCNCAIVNEFLGNKENEKCPECGRNLL
jgi:hypothetical protein